jgi:cation:H+ antiporter
MDLLTFILFVMGFVLLIWGAEFLVRGASRLAVSAGISPLVVGLTVVAYGTSTPELAVTIQSTFAGQADIALGNVVGSNISNVLLVLGLAALIGPLIVARQLVRFDIPLMIGVSFLVLFMGLDGTIGRSDGLILVAIAVGYTIFVLYQSRKASKAVRVELDKVLDEVIATTPVQLLVQLGLIIMGLALLVIGSNWLINGAVMIAELLGVSKLVVGLTVVAVGTSLPEIATSIVASFRGERDIAVGNVVGSNIFNILFVLGLSGIVGPAGVAVSTTALSFDIPVMILVAMACAPVFLTGYVIARWEGLLFFSYYIAYTVYLFLNVAESWAVNTFNIFMIAFAVPITVIILGVSLVRYIQNQRRTTLQAKSIIQETIQPPPS